MIWFYNLFRLDRDFYSDEKNQGNKIHIIFIQIKKSDIRNTLERIYRRIRAANFYMIRKVLGFWSKCFKNILATPGCSQRSLYTQSGMYKLLSFKIIIIIQSPEGLKLSNWNLVHNQIKIPFSCKMSKIFYDKTCTCHKSLSGKFLKGNFIHYSELFLTYLFYFYKY